MRRIGLAVVLAVGLALVPLAAEAQMRKIPRLCFVTFDPGTPEAPSPRFAGFFQACASSGMCRDRALRSNI
jgi:putative tryptophan/tyrosine transport system substrate-binding protein